MTQSKNKSLIEAIVNTFVGFLVTLFISPIIYWMFNIEISYPQMTGVTIAFTIISILRNYIIRRWFNKLK